MSYAGWRLSTDLQTRFYSGTLVTWMAGILVGCLDALEDTIIPFLKFPDFCTFCYEHQRLGLDACLGIGLGGAALALGAPRVIFCT
jgi:hypothetical protein